MVVAVVSTGTTMPSSTKDAPDARCSVIQPKFMPKNPPASVSGKNTVLTSVKRSLTVVRRSSRASPRAA